ncbi:MAG: class I SAM-dependent methyltransferase [Candidatus Aminicenantes bacterium]|nr:class I SAM-dependent methyltransferase [Candidatus Aminicenantes bacterium]
MSESKHSHRVCPWWLGYFLATPLRRFLQNPRTILKPWVSEGAMVIEPGPGMGFFTLELARLVGPRGRVVALDIQPKMLSALKRRARRKGLLGRIDVRLVKPESMGLTDIKGRADLVFAFAIVHELPRVEEFFREVYEALKAGGKLFISEPHPRVSEEDFAGTVRLAEAAGFKENARPAIPRSRSVLMARGD